MTQQSNISFMVEQLRKLARAEGLSDARFDVVQAETDEPMNSTFEEIMHCWALPKAERDGLSPEEAAKLLTAGNNTIPLWVKVQTSSPGRCRLTISQRFRKRKVAQSWHNDSPTYPFMMDGEIQPEDGV